MRQAVLSSLREVGREVDFVCSTDDIDSYDEVVRQNWDLKRFQRNPVALWAHEAKQLPIGHWKAVSVKNGQLEGTLVVASAAANPQAECVWNSLKEGTLRAVSVGFMPHKIGWEEIDGAERMVLDDNELYEISVTPIPANAEALGKMIACAREAFLVERNAVTYEGTKPVDTGTWDAGNTLKRIRKWASSDGSGDINHIDWNKYKRAFAWYDPSRSHEVGGYKLCHHDIKNGELVTSRAGVIAAAVVLSGGRGGVKIPESEISAVKAHIAKHYRQFDMTPPWENKQAPTGAKEITIMSGKKDDGDEEMSKAVCPECGHEFTPEKAKKDFAGLRTKVADLELKSVEGATALAKAKTELDAVTAEKKALAASLEAARAKELELQGKLFAADLEPLIGVKMAPAEREGVLEIAKLFAVQGEAGATKWKAHVEGIKSRPDMSQKVGSSVVGTEPPAAHTTRSVVDDGGEELVSMLKSSASN